MVLLLLCLLSTLQVPLRGMSFTPNDLFTLGGLVQQALWAGEWYRLATHLFLHGSWLHLIINGVSLYFVGTVLERAVGPAAFLFFLFASAMGGAAASLLVPDTDAVRVGVGISGGIAGLIGLILALEWSMTDSLGAFFKRRNVRMVIFLIVANGLLAYFIGRIGDGQLDHAAHIGGLLLGLVAGLAYYTRSGIRVGRGVAITLLLVVPPLAYAGRSILDPDYHRFLYARAQDDEARIRHLRDLLELEPQNIRAAVRLTELTGEPDALEALDPPLLASDANAIGNAWLKLAMRGLPDDPDRARAYAERAASIESAELDLWVPFGEQALQAGQDELADYAFRQGYAAARAQHRWRAAWALLQRHSEAQENLLELEVYTHWLTLAGEAAGGLTAPNLKPEGRAQLRRQLLNLTTVAERIALRERGPYARALSAYYGRLADRAPEDGPELGLYDFKMAIWFWLSMEDPTDPEQLEMAAGRFETAWQSAHRTRHFKYQAYAEAWFRQRGLPVPEPELADPEEGG